MKAGGKLTYQSCLRCVDKLRSSRPEVFCEKGVLRNFTKFTGKHLCQRLFLIKLQAGVYYF